MARHQRRILAASSVQDRFASHREMPWSEIEAVVGQTFVEGDRREIFECAQAYWREYDRVSNGALEQVVNELREQLVTCSQGVAELADRFIPVGGQHQDDEDRKALEALCLMNGGRDFALRDELHKMAIAANKIRHFLSHEPESEWETTARAPESVGLEAFIPCVLDYSETKAARREPGYKVPGAGGAKEFERWGVAIGPKAKAFQTLVNAVIDQNLTQHQIRTAFENARRKGALSASEAYDRASNKG